jgi:hypothetical protein
MSDALKHECGVAMLRLLKPLEFYKEKYGTSFYGLKKMYLLMEKQRNREAIKQVDKLALLHKTHMVKTIQFLLLLHLRISLKLL